MSPSALFMPFCYFCHTVTSAATAVAAQVLQAHTLDKLFSTLESSSVSDPVFHDLNLISLTDQSEFFKWFVYLIRRDLFLKFVLNQTVSV